MFGGSGPYRAYLLGGDGKYGPANTYDRPSKVNLLFIKARDGANATVDNVWEGTKTIAGATKDLASQAAEHTMDATRRWAGNIVQAGNKVKDTVIITTNKALTWTYNTSRSAANATGSVLAVGVSTVNREIVRGANVTVFVGEAIVGLHQTFVAGGKVPETPIQGYDKMIHPSRDRVLSGQVGVDFYTVQVAPPPGYSPSAIFEIRHSYRVPPVVGPLPHSPLIKMESGEKPTDLSVMFNNPPASFVNALKTSKAVNLFFHGYNVPSRDEPLPKNWTRA